MVETKMIGNGAAGSSEGWHITPATSAEAPTIARFNILLAKETENLELDQGTVLSGVARGLSKAPEVRYLLARENLHGDPVGQLMLTREWSDWRDGWVWWIQSVYVEQAFRRRGVMRALFRQVMEMAKADSGPVVLVRLYVEEHNGRAQAFYQGMGMADEGYRVWAWKTR